MSKGNNNSLKFTIMIAKMSDDTDQDLEYEEFFYGDGNDYDDEY